jgi:CheY-like chemotaxis protein
MIIKRCFETAGYCNIEFFQAEDGIEALDVLNNSIIDLIIADINMPKLNGEDLVRKIKLNEKQKNIPVIIISSNENDVLKKELESLGIVGFIQKPVKPENILSLIGEYDGKR